MRVACAVLGLAYVATLLASLERSPFPRTCTLIAVIIPFIAWGFSGIRVRKPYEARVDERGLSLDDRVRWRRSALKSVQWFPVAGSKTARVHLLKKPFGGTMLECETHEDARALVEALEFAPQHRSATFAFYPALGPIRRWGLRALYLATSMALLLALQAVIPLDSRGSTLVYVISVLSYLAVGPLVLLLSKLLLRSALIKVDVGLDGIRIRRGKSDRFVPFASVEWKRTTSPTVLAFKAAGEPEEQWWCSSGFDTFWRRIEDAEHRTSETAPAIAIAPTLTTGYRQSTYPNDVLLRVVEDHGQDIATRTAAADALHSVLESHERDRVREVAATTASADLRRHLEELADSDAEATDRPRVTAR